MLHAKERLLLQAVIGRNWGGNRKRGEGGVMEVEEVEEQDEEEEEK